MIGTALQVLQRYGISDRARSRLLAGSLLLAFASTWETLGTTHAQSLPINDATVTVHRVVARSIFAMHVQDPFLPLNISSPVTGALSNVSTLALPKPNSIPLIPATAATYTLQGILRGTPTLAEFQSTSDVDDTQILQVGDTLGDRTIAAIGNTFVRFTDGSMVTLSDGTSSTPPPLTSGTLVPNIPLLSTPVLVQKP